MTIILSAVFKVEKGSNFSVRFKIKGLSMHFIKNNSL
jgi:hypothetical protein